MPDQPNDTEKIRPKRWHSLLHTLWSKATSQPSYEKTEWMELEHLPTTSATELRVSGVPATVSEGYLLPRNNKLEWFPRSSD